MTTVVNPALAGKFSISNLEKIRTTEGHFLKILIYGPHGAGKTTLAGSAADVESMRDVLVVSAEGGTVVFENNPRIQNAANLDVIKIDRIEQFQKVYEWLRAHLHVSHDPKAAAALQEKVMPGEKRQRHYRTVIVDSLTEIEAICLAKILNLEQVGFDVGDEMQVAGWPQFRQNTHLMQRIIRQFRDLDINVIMTCAQQFAQDERKAYHYTPKMTGQLSGIIQGFFDVVGWLVASQPTGEQTVAPRRLFVQPQVAPKADAKCRLASFQGSFFDNPTMADIMKETGSI